MTCTPQGIAVPKEPIVFSKFASTITNPNDPIIFNPETKELDFEVELAIVIGKKAKRVTVCIMTMRMLSCPYSSQAANAMEHVAGFTVAHDVSARDWQLKRNGGQWLLGKVGCLHIQ